VTVASLPLAAARLPMMTNSFIVGGIKRLCHSQRAGEVPECGLVSDDVRFDA